ncbi:MAG: type 1 glutamine amidotransferase domain-containing protein [Alteromonas sp.]|uniref:type 1 glutamine amidotransferase domain-containing protein n=1 Tax=Alteromonas sp. MB-3u-76 TaxID=2058133 RepID=UPI000C30B3D6|nr:type 1 glutamine amidotransferase domain-containing protein [Alteromonas sp. MB-3u-76]AUC89607.1 type 1 glutamine amidotransferase domain-containing protein [Alteromonas sp. MB-3u-76]MAI64162.1 type 1 glutamine amidotransferase domain-containing protein [Alteromonas sp.]
MSKSILMVMTSHEIMGDTGNKTGMWLEEFASPYYAFKDAGYSITLASPMGGQVPIDPNSLSDDAMTDDAIRYTKDDVARSAVASTIPLEDVRAEEFDAVFYPGGHGPLWDLSDNAYSIKLIEDTIAANKPVGAVCHAPIVLKDVKNPDGSFLVDGKAVTGFSNSEEAAMQLTDVVPYLVEDELKSKGGKFESADDFAVKVCTDGLLVTGQNPPSSRPAADALIKLIS